MKCPTCDREGYEPLLFGHRLRAIRESRNLTLREVEKESGIPFNSLGRAERGHMPGLHTFAAICKWAGIDVRWGIESFQGESS